VTFLARRAFLESPARPRETFAAFVNISYLPN